MGRDGGQRHEHLLTVPVDSPVVLAGLAGRGQDDAAAVGDPPDRLRLRHDRTGGMCCLDGFLVLPRAVARTTGAVAVGPSGLSLLRPRRRAA